MFFDYWVDINLKILLFTIGWTLPLILFRFFIDHKTGLKFTDLIHGQVNELLFSCCGLQLLNKLSNMLVHCELSKGAWKSKYLQSSLL